MKKLLSGVLSLCMTATVAVPFVSAETTMCYNDYVKDCVNFCKYQVRYNYDVNGTKFTHEYRVFDKEEIEKLDVIPGYTSCEVEEYTHENAPFEIPEKMAETYKKTVTEAFNTLSYYVCIYFFDKDGNEVYETHAYTIEDAQKIVDEYDGEYATYDIQPYLLGVKPINANSKTEPCDTLSGSGYKEVSLEYVNEAGSVLSFVNYGLINKNVCKDIMESTTSENENCTGYRIALYDDIDAYQSAYKVLMNDNSVQAPYEGEYLLGDITGEGIVDLTDLTYLSLYLLKDRDFDEREYASADIQTDGEVNIADLAAFKEAITPKPVG